MKQEVRVGHPPQFNVHRMIRVVVRRRRAQTTTPTAIPRSVQMMTLTATIQATTITMITIAATSLATELATEPTMVEPTAMIPTAIMSYGC